MQTISLYDIYNSITCIWEKYNDLAVLPHCNDGEWIGGIIPIEPNFSG